MAANTSDRLGANTCRIDAEEAAPKCWADKGLETGLDATAAAYAIVLFALDIEVEAEDAAVRFVACKDDVRLAAGEDMAAAT